METTGFVGKRTSEIKVLCSLSGLELSVIHAYVRGAESGIMIYYYGEEIAMKVSIIFDVSLSNKAEKGSDSGYVPHNYIIGT